MLEAFIVNFSNKHNYMSSFFVRFFYTLLLFIASPFLLLSLYKKKPGKPRFGHRWKEHFGVTPAIKSKKPIWIHAVSVGESIAAVPIIKKLKEINPDQAILVTTTTSTGAQQINKLGDLVEHRYMPLDFSWCVRSFIDAVQPEQLLIMETELWPNTLHTVAREGIAITVVNARLSERSCKRYSKIQVVFNLLADNVSQFLCQYEGDAQRFLRLGVQSDRVHVTGSVKFDITISDSILESCGRLRSQLGQDRPVWIAASTHKGEDEQIFHAHRVLREAIPDALLIIVPRHPERFKQVEQMSNLYGFNTVARSSGKKVVDDVSVYVGDTMGEMLLLIGAADICFMAGSLIGDKVGGHNMVEPAALGKPIINGPSYFNFSEIANMFIEQGAMSLITTPEELALQLKERFASEKVRLSMGLAGKKVVDDNRGALNNTIALINKDY